MDSGNKVLDTYSPIQYMTISYRLYHVNIICLMQSDLSSQIWEYSFVPRDKCHSGHQTLFIHIHEGPPPRANCPLYSSELGEAPELLSAFFVTRQVVVYEVDVLGELCNFASRMRTSQVQYSDRGWKINYARVFNLVAIVYTCIPRYVRDWGPGIKTVVSMHHICVM